jgi:hypothetical protein
VQNPILKKVLTVALMAGVLLSIAVLTMPNLLSSRKSANESSAVGSLRTLNTALISYSSKDSLRSYPADLSQLSPYIDANLATGEKSGYRFHYRAVDADHDGIAESFIASAEPIQPGTTGTQTFAIDQTGVVKRQSAPGTKMETLDGSEAPASAAARPPSLVVRKMVRNGSLDLTVSRPEEALEQLRLLAERLGGFVETSKLEGQATGHPFAAVSIRVPALRYPQARTEIRAIGQHVNDEHDDVRDVTGPYVDLEATLRNYRAEETQYLDIMRRAGSIKDTLAVAEKLADVRGRIERTQGELNVLSQQVEMATITVTLRAESVVQPTEVRWHASAEVKAAFWSAVDNLATYANFMIAFLFQLPVMLLWVATAFVVFGSSWKMLRWTWRRLATATAGA